MIRIGAELYLDRQHFEAAGIPYRTVQSARDRGSEGYSVIKHPTDKRRILLHYGSLKPELKALVDARFGNVEVNSRLDGITAMLTEDANDMATLRAFTYGEPAQHLPTWAVEGYARACAWLRLLATTPKAVYNQMGHATATQWYAAVAEVFSTGIDPAPLPTTYGKVAKLVQRYKEEGPCAVVGKHWGNGNRRKIGEAENAWLVASYAQPTKPDVVLVAAQYQAKAEEMAWPALSVSAIFHHLNRPEVKRQWFLGRHGDANWKALYGHTLKLEAASHRDALWVGDGTKLNLFYRDKKGMDASMQMYIVIDAHSHAILGWSLGARENMLMQYAAAKMALTYSQAKPLQWLYDGQSGHTSGAGEDFYTRASRLHFPSQPYNPKGKPVERIIGEFQKQVMRRHWAFTGQNITAKRLDSRPNMEFIKANKDRLPELHELWGMMQEMVNAWNAGEHAKVKGQSRIAVYDESTNPTPQRLDLLDMVELFWVKTRGNVYRKHGLDLEVKEAVYTYEVYDQHNRPDERFRELHTNARFIVRYDPDMLDYVVLYSEVPGGGLRYVATAQAKHTVARAVVDLKPGDRSTINHSLELRKREVEEAKASLEELRERSGVNPELLIELAPYGGGGKDAFNHAEAELILVNAPQAPVHRPSPIVPYEKPDIDPYDLTL